MRYKLTAVVLGVLVIVASTGWKYAAAAESKPTLIPQDYIDIYNLYGIYSRYTDMGYGDDGSNYASMFTVDGEFNGNNRPNNTRIGREVQARTIHNQQAGWVREGRSRRHTTTNIVVTPSVEGARGSAYLLIFNVTANPPFVESGGIYDDYIVKTTEGWKFKKRIYWTQFDPALPKGMENLFSKK